MSKRKSNATSFKKGGGRKAGTPNKTTRTFREAVLAEAAGNGMGREGPARCRSSLNLNSPRRPRTKVRFFTLLRKPVIPEATRCTS